MGEDVRISSKYGHHALAKKNNNCKVNVTILGLLYHKQKKHCSRRTPEPNKILRTCRCLINEFCCLWGFGSRSQWINFFGSSLRNCLASSTSTLNWKALLNTQARVSRWVRWLIHTSWIERNQMQTIWKRKRKRVFDMFNE